MQTDVPIFQGVMSVLHWVFLAFLAVPTALVAVRAATEPEDRVAWTALSIGLVLWTLGFAVQALDGHAPDSPGPEDAIWLTAYAFPLAALYLFARPWLRRAPRTLLLDTLLVLLGTTAVITALVLPPVATNVSGLGQLAQAVNFAYPLIDGVLASVAIIGAAVAGRRARLALGCSWRSAPSPSTAGDASWVQRAADGTWSRSCSPTRSTRCGPRSSRPPPGCRSAASAARSPAAASDASPPP